MKWDENFQQEIRERIIAAWHPAPDQSKIDPVLFTQEWQEEMGLGGYFRLLAERVLGRKGSRNGAAVAEEVLRLALNEACESGQGLSEGSKDGRLSEPQEAWLRYHRMVRPLVDWFHDNARILRWRSEPTPYHVWVSEIMLQQTRVEAVKAYFDRFVEALPDIRALAECPEEKLLKLWEGLGYYSRVRNLQKAAILVCQEYGGKLPASYEELQKLPGIGSYTAGAIASIAYGQPAPAVDGNVLRVTKRIMASQDDITRAPVKREMEQMIGAISEQASREGIYPGDLSQALMELGAMICIPVGKPLCDQCPLAHLCRVSRADKAASGKKAEELWRRIPAKPIKKERKIEEHTILVLQQGDHFAIRKRSPKGLLSGMWELPGLEGKRSEAEVREILLRQMGDGPDAHRTEILAITPLGEAKHIFSHVEWHMIGYAVRLTKGLPGMHMITWEELETEYSLPSAFDYYRKKIQEGK